MKTGEDMKMPSKGKRPPPRPRPYTAMPIGGAFLVRRPVEDEGETIFTSTADGCFQRRPTCRD